MDELTHDARSSWPNTISRVVLAAPRKGQSIISGQLDRFASAVIPAALEAVLSRVDLTDVVIRHVDLDRVVAAVDVDAVAYRLDLLGIAHYIIDGVDLPAIVRSSSASFTVEAVRGVRKRSVDADDAITRVIGHVLPHRRNGSSPAVASEPTGDPPSE